MNVKLLTATYAVALVLLVGCGQKDPTGFLPTGSIFVTSNVTGASILLDGEATGKVTPDTLTLVDIGDHTVAVELPCHASDPGSTAIDVETDQVHTASFTLTAYERVVLLEDYSNTSCVPCVESDAAVIETLESFGAEGCRVVGIQYHVSWPSPFDPFYLAARTENNARTSYYGVDGVGVPYVVIDGIELLPPNQGAEDASQMRSAVERRLKVTSPIELTVRNTINGSSGQAEVDVTVLSEVPTAHYHIRIAVVESDIHYVADNGLTHFDNVLRDMLPNADGSTLSDLVVGSMQTITESYTIDGEWKAGDLSVIAFVQNEDTKEIIQAATSMTQ